MISYSFEQSRFAYLLITCDEGKLDDVYSDVILLKEVKEIQETVGAYDIIAKAESSTREYLDRFLLEKIRKIPSIRSIMMLHCTVE